MGTRRGRAATSLPPADAPQGTGPCWSGVGSWAGMPRKVQEPQAWDPRPWEQEGPPTPGRELSHGCERMNDGGGGTQEGAPLRPSKKLPLELHFEP